MSNRLIIISNRLPVQINETDKEIRLSPSDGGLVSSIKSFLRKTQQGKERTFDKVIWLGALSISEKNFRKHKLEDQLVDHDFDLSPLFLSKSVWEKYYNGFCNDTIWPLFHYFPSYAKFKDDHYKSYMQVNKVFAENITTLYQPGDVIWIHDYHLMLLPQLLRERLPEAKIGFFLHIPFPAFELFRMLPALWRRQLLDGMLGADLVGFHTNSYAQHFINSVKQLLGYEASPDKIQTTSRSVAIEAFPISIDYSLFGDVTGNPEIFEERNRIRKKLGECRLVISVDRLDYTKGIINRLEGFELFLRQHPEFSQRITFMMVIVPSRDVISKYAELKQAIDGIVGKINSRYGTLDWTPVIYQYRSLDFVSLNALYLAADVALITPVRDGMNLVAKEFVASRGDRRGVLILSETTGAAAELGEALIINPTDRQEVSDALLKALSMPLAEQIMRNEFMQRRLKDYDVIRWADEFLAQLSTAHEEHKKSRMKMLTPDIASKIRKQYAETDERLFLLDYDGTLTGIVRHPHMAVPDAELKKLLQNLSSEPRNRVVIISGRSKKDMERWFADVPVELVAEHGAFSRLANGEWTENCTTTLDWMKQVEGLMQGFSNRCPGSLVEVKNFSVAWHYRMSDKELGFVRSRELLERLGELSAHAGFHVLQGNCVIEARPRDVNKGVSAQKIINERDYNFIFAAGDDRTDEDVFAVLPGHAHSIRVGVTYSQAIYNAEKQEDIPKLLKELTNLPSEHPVQVVSEV